ncbi:MAG: 3-hexulose-6-phosphate synthase [Lachnospiraceae bacterium]|nr:3-hexulose-6-phosphate synthase [Lachnospiraceae bacterium]
MKSKLQIALDDVTMEDAWKLLEKVHAIVDIVEVGTPFMMEYGMEAVRKIKNSFPDLEVLCDTKIVDAGAYEADMAFQAGADYVTVLGVTDERTIADVVKAAAKAGKKVMADMIRAADLGKRIARIEELGVDVIAVHTGVDQQAMGRTPLDDLKEMRACVKHTALAVAGGIKPETIDEYLKYKPEIVIVGGGIAHTSDPAAAAEELAKHIRSTE